MSIEPVERYLREHRDEFVDDLKRLIAQPSVSASGEGIRDCAELESRLCEKYGFDDIRTLETDGHPYVVARAFVDHDPENDRPTMLIYGHYDTQPVTEADWSTPPFEPTVVDGPDGRPRIHARGAGDNKGNHFPHICAVGAYRRTVGLPLNVTLLLDGEEEIGSPNVDAVVRDHGDLLDADVHFSADGSIHESGRPVLKLGSRGILPIRIDVRGANKNLHSGHWGGSVPSAAWELIRILGTMKDETGSVAIDGFYEDVRELTDLDREVLSDIPIDEEALKAELGISGLEPGPGETHLEKTLYYPTVNVSGLGSGYIGEGFQNITPAEAHAQIDIRLVVDQSPDDIYEKFVDHVERHESGLLDVDVKRMASRSPDRAPVDYPLLEPVKEALATVWGTEPIVYPTSGASGPSDAFYTGLGLPKIGVGYANSDEQQHSPHETMALHCFDNGVRSTVHVFKNVADALDRQDA